MLRARGRLVSRFGVLGAVVGFVFLLIGVAMIPGAPDWPSAAIGVGVASLGGFFAANGATEGVFRTGTGIRVRWMLSKRDYSSSDVTDITIGVDRHEIVPLDVVFPQMTLRDGEHVDMRMLSAYRLRKTGGQRATRSAFILAEWCDVTLDSGEFRRDTLSP